MYKKRSGTSGISGHLYETKLISLLLSRLQRNEAVEEFHLATNMDGIGSFDDVCLKMKIKSYDRPIFLFMQMKHRENDDKFLSFDNDISLGKLANSILNIKEKFCGNNDDNLFNGKFDDTDCLFILYTNAKYEVGDNILMKFPLVNELIATNESFGSQPIYTEKDVDDVATTIAKDEITIFVNRFVQFFGKKSNQSMNIMNDDYMLRYHVFLARNIVDVSEIQSGAPNFRFLSIREEFFHVSENKYICLFQNLMFKQIIKEQKNDTEKKLITSKKTVDELICSFLCKPSAITLSPLIETQVTYKYGKLIFTSDRPQCQVQQLEKIHIKSTTVEEAIAMAAKTILISIKLKVPVTFGNLDLTIRGNTPEKIDKRLNYLRDIIVDFCKNAKISNNYKIITIAENIDRGLSSPNGGLGGIIGNLLEHDENTNFLKFSENCSLLQVNARNLLLKLKDELNNLHDYRVNIINTKFPTHSLDCRNLAQDFLSRMIIFGNQGNHDSVEKILKEELQDYMLIHPQDIPIDSETVFIYYHHEIQKWWMSPKLGPYLTKQSNIYQEAINNILTDPEINALQTSFFLNKIRNIEYKFTRNATEWLNSLDASNKAIITTNITELTVMKVVQYLHNMNSRHAILDLEYIVQLSGKKFEALKSELRNTGQIIIIVCNIFPMSRIWNKRLDELSEVIEQKNFIVIANIQIIGIIKEYFEIVDTVYNDEDQSLIDLTHEPLNDILCNTNITFQGQEMRLDSFLDPVSLKFVRGQVLSSIICNKTIVIGKPVTNKNYENIKDFYIDRRVSQKPVLSTDPLNSEDNIQDVINDVSIYHVRTFYDINKDVVLLTATSGMGKSSMLTNLSIKTKELDPKVWIVRINLIEYSNTFYQWNTKSTMDTLDTLKFLCQVACKKNDVIMNLKDIDSQVYLESCTGDDWDTFEIRMFLHFYNSRKLILLFDGFDEICPNYKNSVIRFLNVIKHYPRQNKMWVTSRPYVEILPELQNVLGKSHELEYTNAFEQKKFLKSFWNHKWFAEDVTQDQIANITLLFRYMSKIAEENILPETALDKILYLFYDYCLSPSPDHVTSEPEVETPGQIESFTPRTRERSDSFSNYSSCTDLTGVNSWRSNLWNAIFNEKGNINSNNDDADKFLGTPLLLYLLAEFIVGFSTDWKAVPQFDILSVYRIFVETKFKKILFQDKNNMDIYRPDIIMRCEKDLANCIEMHKKLGIYCILKRTLFYECYRFDEFKNLGPFGSDGMMECVKMLDEIIATKEKSGLIVHVTVDKIPLFIHLSFAEYFAAEYLYDIMKNDQVNFHTKCLLLATIAVLIPGLHIWFKYRAEVDMKFRNSVSYLLKRLPFMSLWFQEILKSVPIPMEQYIRIVGSTVNDYEEKFLEDYSEDNFKSKLNNLSPNDRQTSIVTFVESIIRHINPV